MYYIFIRVCMFLSSYKRWDIRCIYSQTQPANAFLSYTSKNRMFTASKFLFYFLVFAEFLLKTFVDILQRQIYTFLPLSILCTVCLVINIQKLFPKYSYISWHYIDLTFTVGRLNISQELLFQSAKFCTRLYLMFNFLHACHTNHEKYINLQFDDRVLQTQ